MAAPRGKSTPRQLDLDVRMHRHRLIHSIVRAARVRQTIPSDDLVHRLARRRAVHGRDLRYRPG